MLPLFLDSQLCLYLGNSQVSVYRTIGPLVLFVPGVFCCQHFVGHLVSRTISIWWKGVYDSTEIWKDYGGSCSFMWIQIYLKFHKNNSGFWTRRPLGDDSLWPRWWHPLHSVVSVIIGGEWGCRNTQVSGMYRSHGTPGPKSPARRPTQRSTPARSQTVDLAGKYGDLAVSQVILRCSNSADGQNPPLGDSTLGTLSTG